MEIISTGSQGATEVRTMRLEKASESSEPVVVMVTKNERSGKSNRSTYTKLAKELELDVTLDIARLEEGVDPEYTKEKPFAVVGYSA